MLSRDIEHKMLQTCRQNSQHIQMPWIVTEYISDTRDMLEKQKETPKRNNKQQDKDARNLLFQK